MPTALQNMNLNNESCHQMSAQRTAKLIICCSTMFAIHVEKANTTKQLIFLWKKQIKEWHLKHLTFEMEQVSVLVWHDDKNTLTRDKMALLLDHLWHLKWKKKSIQRKDYKERKFYFRQGTPLIDTNELCSISMGIK